MKTIRHLIPACPRWTEARKELRAAVGHRSSDVPFLLGGWGTRKDGKGLDGPRERWKSNMEVFKAIILSPEQAGRLAYHQHVAEA